MTKDRYILLRSFLKPNKKITLSAILASILGGCTSALLMALIGKQFVNIGSFDGISIVWFLVLLTTSVLTNLLAAKLLITSVSQYTRNLRLQLCRQILNTPFEKIENVGTARLQAMLTEDLNTISTAFVQMPSVIINFSRAFFCILYLLWISPLAMCLILLTSVPTVYVMVLLNRNSRTLIRSIFPVRDHRFQLYKALTEGIKELNVNRQWAYLFLNNHLLPNADNFKSIQEKSFMASQYVINWGQCVYFIIILTVLIFSSHGYFSLEVVAAFALVGLFLRASITSLLNSIPAWQRATTAVQNINSFKLSEPISSEIPDCTIQKALLQKNMTLELQELAYTYSTAHGKESVRVGPFNLQFESNKITFLTGGNGSGKTTLVKLIAALYQPTTGQIVLNGTPVEENSTESFRTKICPVFSEFFSFDAIIDELIQKSSINTNNLIATLQLKEVFKRQPGSIDSRNLSSGQKARIALLPVFLSEKPIVIFDEWAANQDPDFKKIFYYELLPQLRKSGRMVIAVTHDSNYFDAADRVITLGTDIVTHQAV